MYEELINNLRSIKDVWQTQNEEWMLQAADAIESLNKRIDLEYLRGYADGLLSVNKEKNNRWISVKEKLPEGPGEYIVTYRYPWYKKEKCFVGLDSFRGKTCWAKQENRIVDAWMPKPEPYEEPAQLTDNPQQYCDKAGGCMICDLLMCPGKQDEKREE